MRGLKGLKRLLRVGLVAVCVLGFWGCNANENNEKKHNNSEPKTCGAISNPQQAIALQNYNRANKERNKACSLAESAKSYYEQFILVQYQKAMENTKEYKAYQQTKQVYENTKEAKAMEVHELLGDKTPPCGACIERYRDFTWEAIYEVIQNTKEYQIYQIAQQNYHNTKEYKAYEAKRVELWEKDSHIQECYTAGDAAYKAYETLYESFLTHRSMFEADFNMSEANAQDRVLKNTQEEKVWDKALRALENTKEYKEYKKSDKESEEYNFDELIKRAYILSATKEYKAYKVANEAINKVIDQKGLYLTEEDFCYNDYASIETDSNYNETDAQYAAVNKDIQAIISSIQVAATTQDNLATSLNGDFIMRIAGLSPLRWIAQGNGVRLSKDGTIDTQNNCVIIDVSAQMLNIEIAPLYSSPLCQKLLKAYPNPLRINLQDSLL
ncbi:hypothetical protein [Helicobacter sp. T3_23-1059]